MLDLFKILEQANRFIKTEFFALDDISRVVSLWDELVTEYLNEDSTANNESAYFVAEQINQLTNNPIFLSTPHLAISLLLLGEQSIKLKAPQLAQEYLTDARIILNKVWPEDPNYYSQLFLELGYMHYCSNNFFDSEKVFLELFEIFTKTQLTHSAKYFLLLNLLVELYSVMGHHSKVDNYFNMIRNLNNPKLAANADYHKQGEINDFNLVAHHRYADSLLKRKRFIEAEEILSELEYFLERENIAGAIKNEIHTKHLLCYAQLNHDDSYNYLADSILVMNNDFLDTIEKCKTLGIYATILHKKGDLTSSKELMRYTIENWKDIRVLDLPLYCNFLAWYGYIHYSMGEKEKAKEIFVQTINFRFDSIKEYAYQKYQDDKYYLLTKIFGQMWGVYEFLINEYNLFPDLILTCFEYNLKMKCFLYGDEFNFPNSYKSYSDLVNVLDDDEAYIMISRVHNLANFGMVYTFFIVTKETESYPEFLYLLDGEDLEGKFYNSFLSHMQNKSIDMISYKAYWEKVDSKIKNKRKIYISPDGIYQALSFESFRDNFEGHLFHKKEFIFIADVDPLFRKKSKKEIIISSAVLLGNPTFQNGLEGNQLFPELVGSMEEIESIGALLTNHNIDTVILSSDTATKEFLLDNINRNLIHLSTHGIIEFPELDEDLETFFSNEYLLLFDSVTVEDSHTKIIYSNVINADEIRHLHLDNVELVVLSSCLSGLGQLNSYGDLIGFPLALFTAGCKNVLISLWKVDDTITKELMISFYKYLFESKDPLKALRNAKELIASEHKHPYFWGGFILVRK